MLGPSFDARFQVLETGHNPLIPLPKRKLTNGELIEEIMKKDSEASRAELEKEAFKSLQRDAKKIKIDL